MSQINTPELAQRLARAIVSDIKLYETEKIKKGREHDNLFALLKDPLEEGRRMYKGRLAPDFDITQKYYDYAIVDGIYAKA